MIASVADLTWIDAAIDRARTASMHLERVRQRIETLRTVTEWRADAADAYRQARDDLAVRVQALAIRLELVEADLRAERTRALAEFGALVR